MKKTIKALKFSIVSVAIVSFFLACDKDYAVLESDVLGEENTNFNTNTELLSILAYNKKLEALQINGLSSNLLGVYNDPAFGQTTASIVTQLIPVTDKPDFGINPLIESVILNIPYYSRVIGVDAEGNSTYTISDSLYGKYTDGSIDPIKLTIYQNTYFLRDFDPTLPSNGQQNYYSRADGTMNATENFALNGTSVINFDTFKGDLVYENASFKPSNAPIKTTTGEGATAVTTQSAPALNVSLSTAFWKAAIIDEGGNAVLSNASNFKNYFRGLYFKAEALDAKGNMILLNLAATNANITINYTKELVVGGERTKGTYVLNFKGGNILNAFTNNFTVPLANGDTTLGDDKLYIKGAEGSMAVVDLFNGQKDYTDENGTTTNVSALDYFKKTYRISDGSGGYKKDVITGNFKLKRLINDAILTVYEDQSMLTQAVYKNGDDYHKYDRLYVYDIKNNIPLIDYGLDPTFNNVAVPFNSTYFHLGQRKTDKTTNVSKYKIHLTEHLNNILLKDSTNVKLGLMLSTNVNQFNSAKLLNSADGVTAIPAAAIITPRGTILRGTNVSDGNKMKLEVFFTAHK